VLVRDEVDHFNTHFRAFQAPMGLASADDRLADCLSQVRESATFSGIPNTERLAEHERTCGVCAIDLNTW
jgi:hypothetical protein